MISCQSLTKCYGAFCALDRLTIEVPSGQIWALIGPNGAGKSTTLSLIAGLQRPTSGSVAVLGLSPYETKQAMGVMPEDLGLFEDLTIEEHLLLTADVYRAPRTRIGPLLRALSLENTRKTFACDCSHGMRKKTSFAMAVLHNPKVLLLDEPFEAVDPVGVRSMCEILRYLSRECGATVILSSHIFSITERVADCVALIRSGTLIQTVGDVRPGDIERLYFELMETPVWESTDWLEISRS